MGMLDKLIGNADELKVKAAELARQHGDKIDQGIDKASESLSKATSGKYDHQIGKGVQAAKSGLTKLQEQQNDETTPGTPRNTSGGQGGIRGNGLGHGNDGGLGRDEGTDPSDRSGTDPRP